MFVMFVSFPDFMWPTIWIPRGDSCMCWFGQLVELFWSLEISGTYGNLMEYDASF